MLGFGLSSKKRHLDEMMRSMPHKLVVQTGVLLEQAGVESHFSQRLEIWCLAFWGLHMTIMNGGMNSSSQQKLQVYLRELAIRAMFAFVDDEEVVNVDDDAGRERMTSQCLDVIQQRAEQYNDAFNSIHAKSWDETIPTIDILREFSDLYLQNLGIDVDSNSAAFANLSQTAGPVISMFVGECMTAMKS
jgi:hypothetical protein